MSVSRRIWPSILQGKNVCSTGYRKTAGWFMPMGYLVGSGHMPIVSTDPSVNADAESAASFFGQMCAPRVTSAGPAFVGGTATNYSPLCELCDDAPNGNGCAEDSNYADYLGAFRGE